MKFLKELSIRKRLYLLISLILSLLFIGLAIFLLTKPKETEAGWWNETWMYRREIQISNSNGSDLQDFQVSFVIDTASLITSGKMESTCNDLRVTDWSGNVLPHWIEENNPGCNSASTRVWVKVPTVYDGTNSTSVFVYYGNSSASNIENGDNVFEFFDDFNGTALDSDVWTATGAYSLAGGEITITSGAVYTNETIVPTAQNYIYEYRPRWNASTGSYSGLHIANSQTVGSGNSTSNSLVFYVSDNGSLNIRVWAGDGTTNSYNLINASTQYTASQDAYYVDGFTVSPSNIITSRENRTLTNSYAGTWADAPYLWLGYFTGANAGSASIKSITTDWVIVRQYVASEPTTNTSSTEEVTPAPIAHWKFDEGTGVVAHDASGQGNDGTITGATWKTDDMCVSGNCLYFDSSTQNEKVNVTLNNYSSLTKSLTMSFWYKATLDDDVWDGILNINGGYSGGTRFLVRKDNSTNRIEWQANYGDATPIYIHTGTNNLKVNNWYFITATYDGQEAILYLNGEEVSSYTETRELTLNSSLSLGFAQYYFDGFLDEIKIYPYARSPDQIKSDYASGLSGIGSTLGASTTFGDYSPKWMSDGLVGYWKMDQSSGNTFDYSGNSNHSIVAGTNSYSVGKFGNSLRSGVSTTNLIKNPSVEINTSNWNPGSGNTITRVDTHSYIGSYSAQVYRPSSGGTLYNTWNSVSYQAAVNYVLSMYVRKPDGSAVTSSDITNMFIENSTVGISSITSVGDGWYRFISGTKTATGITSNVGFYMAPDLTVLIDGVQLEQTSVVTPYIDGSLGTGYSWTGTVHDSNSTRSSSTASTTSIVDNSSGTISFWFKAPVLDNSSQCLLGATNPASSGGLTITVKNNGIYTNHIYNGSNNLNLAYNSQIQNETWYYLTYSWNNLSKKGFLSLNGEKVYEGDYPLDILTGSYLQELGSCDLSNHSVFNGSIDEVRIYNRVLSPTEVKDLYKWAPGPVAHYTFDSGDNTTLNDISGYGNTGTWNGSTTERYTEGKLGKGGVFNGTNDYVDIQNNNVFSLNGSITYSAWVKRNISHKFMLWFKHDTYGEGEDRNGIIFSVGDTNKVAALFGQAGFHEQIVSVSEIGPEWTYITITRQGAIAKIYLNGSIDNEVTFSNSSWLGTSIANPTIGRGTWGASWYDGLIDEVRIYNYARTQSQIVEDMQSTGGPPTPVGYWKFDEGSGTTANDSSGLGNDGTITGASWAKEGRVGNSLSFNGTSDYVSIPVDPVNGGQEMSISAWVKPTPSTSGPIAGNMFGWYYRYGIMLHSNGYYYGYFRSSTGLSNLSSLKIPTGNWDHLVVTYDNGNTNIFFNGELTNSGTFQYAPLTQSSNIINIGTHATSADDWFDGLIDEVKIYNTALTPEQVLLDYNQGMTAVMSGSPSTTGNIWGGSASSEYCIPGDTSTCNPPVGEWLFDNNQGSTAKDTSGNGNDGTLLNGATWGAGVNSSALKLDGSTHGVTLNSSVPLGAPDSYTISGWVYITGTTGGYPRWLGNTVASPDLAIHSDGQLSYYNTQLNTSWVPTGKYISLNKWSHLTYIFHNNGLVQIYLNGSLFHSQQHTAGTFSTNYDFVFGTRFNYNGEAIDGLIDQVRIYDYARTPAQIAWDYNRGAPIGHWRLDECQGSTVHDVTGNGNNGTINIGATGTQTSVGTCTSGNTADAWYNGSDGKFNSSLNFDGTDDYILLPKPLIGAGNPFSVSTWVKLNQGTQRLVTLRGEMNYILNVSSDSIGTVTLFSGSWNSVGNISWNTWQNIITTFDGNTFKTYINGVFSNSYNETPTSYSANNTIGIAGYNLSTSPTNGLIDDVRIYNYALTEDQIKLLYNDNASVRF